MSYYEDERQRRKPTREYSRRDTYDDDAYYNSRGQNKTTTLVKRRDSYDDVDEEITREFSPPGARGGYVRETTIRKSGVRPSRARSYDDDDRYNDRYDNDNYGGGRRRDDRRDRSRRRRYDSDDSSRSPSRDRDSKKENRKSKLEETLESLGLGGLVGGILGKESKDGSSGDRDRARSKSRSGRDRAMSETRSERRRSRSRGGPSREQVTQAIKAALLAGAGEAFRARKESGGLTGEMGKRILTAAISAGGVDGLLNHGKNAEEHRTRDTIGSAIAGIATSRIVNGGRSKSRGRNDSRSPDGRRTRSESRGGVRDLLAGGAVAAAAKKVYDRSRSRGRSESRSRYSDTSRSPSRSKSRRRSLSRAAARGLSAVGLTSVASKLAPNNDRKSRRRNSDGYDDRSDYDEYDREVGQPRSKEVSGGGTDWQDGQHQGTTSGSYSLDYGPRHLGDPDTDSDSDLGSSTDEEEERKKGKRKMIVTSGLASIATIHAGHSVYQSYEKRHARRLAVREGRISKEQATNNRNRDRLQDAASLGIAALGLKGAYSEWKEMSEHRSEFRENIEKMERHKKKRENRRKKYERLEKQGYLDSGYATSMPNLHNLPPTNPPPGGWHLPSYDEGHGPYAAGGLQHAPQQQYYYDDNPYAGAYPQSTGQLGGNPLPPPPVGNDHYGQSRAPRERSPSRGRSVR